MNNKVFNNIKSSKPFKKLDVLIYCLVAITVIILFAVFVIFPKKTTSYGFEILNKNVSVLSHVYGTETFSINDNFLGSVKTEKTTGGFIIIVQVNEKYNTLFSDEKNCRVSMIESNCSSSPDCVYMPAVSDNGIIVCVPHGISIRSLASGGFIPPITG